MVQVREKERRPDLRRLRYDSSCNAAFLGIEAGKHQIKSPGSRGVRRQRAHRADDSQWSDLEAGRWPTMAKGSHYWPGRQLC